MGGYHGFNMFMCLSSNSVLKSNFHIKKKNPLFRPLELPPTTYA